MCPNLKSRFLKVLKRLDEALKHAERDPGEVELIAVSKRHPSEKIRQLVGYGQETFGENYANELFKKAEQLSDLSINWVFIGALQSNKISKLVKVCTEIQTASSLKHLRYIDRYAKEHGKQNFKVYLQINISEEPQKSGVFPNELSELLTELPHFENISLQGLMAIPSTLSTDTGDTPHKKLRELCNKMGLRKISVGMSGDLELAVKAGTDCVRIGTDIFGPRPV